MKHLRHLFTALLLLCATAVAAHDFEVGGIYYNILSETDKTVAVTFKGTTYSEYSNEYSGSVVIPQSVTYNGSTYRVTSIGNNTFRYCSGLTSITIPNSVTSIGNYAFQSCSGLTSVEIPNSVTSIGTFAFEACYSIKSLTLGNGVKNYRAAFGAINPEEIYINDLAVFCESDFHLENYLLRRASLYLNGELITDLIIPDGVTRIGVGVFKESRFTSIEIPNSVTSIGDYAFQNCRLLTSVEIPNSVTSIGDKAFAACTRLTSITSLIPAEDLFSISSNVFYNVDKTTFTLYVPYGAKETYASTAGWNEFTNIVELEPTATEVTVTIGQYGSATYCSPYALDFSNVEGLKAYAATGYKSNSQVVTLTRVQTSEAGIGLFLKGEPGEYVVPVIESTDEHSLNMLVGTLEPTIVNSTDGSMSNYKFTIADGDAAPMFYPFEDGTTLSAGKAYLQIPTAWLPATAQKSLSVRFDDGETTDIDELKGESGEVKTIYDLSGRVVENPTSGIYIIDGKKVIIK